MQGSNGSNVAKTPHSAYHYNGKATSSRKFEVWTWLSLLYTRKRPISTLTYFCELLKGWYFRVTVPEHKHSFAIIHAIEDPVGPTPFSKVSSQAVWDISGRSGYVQQHGRDPDIFWAESEKLDFGARYSQPQPTSTTVRQDQKGDSHLYRGVGQGFRSTDTLHYGSIHATQPDGDMLSANNELSTRNRASHVSWAYTMSPIYGWGDSVVKRPVEAAEAAVEGDGNGHEAAKEDIKKEQNEKTTTGYLAVAPVFDPQWQICIAHALASGWFEVDGQRIEFHDEPAYLEKNWGSGFPAKWFWLQCNTFKGHPDLTVTAVGARRRALQPYGTYVDVGIVGIHFGEEFVEMVPWNAEMSWEVAPWGDWQMRGSNVNWEVEISATTTDSGLWLRGPHEDLGFIPNCRDSFQGNMRLKLWRKPSLASTVVHLVTSEDTRELVLDVSSNSAAVEVGGGEWPEPWESKCTIPKLVLDALKKPVDVEKVAADVS